MLEPPVSTTGAPKTRRSGISKLVWVLTAVAAVVTLGSAAAGLILQHHPQSWADWQFVIWHTFKSLAPSNDNLDHPASGEAPAEGIAKILLLIAQGGGIAFSILIAGRVILFALGTFVAEMILRVRSNHDVVIGSGPAAVEYVARAGIRTTHTAVGLDSEWGRIATLARIGALRHQLIRAGARKARRIVVDEGDDATTWETAQEAARVAGNVDVLAHIRDPWIHERLTRTEPEAKVRTFSYSSGAARQVMLAHPPYMLARRFEAPAQHILIFGFGAVGQAVAREFLVTSVATNPARMMITAVDRAENNRGKEFLGVLPGIIDDVDLHYVSGDLRSNGEAIIQAVAARNTAAKICAIYVAIDDERLPLSFAVAVRDQMAKLGLRAPIFICAQYGAGLIDVRQGAGLVGDKNPDLGAVIAKARAERLICDLHLTAFGSWGDALDGSGLFEPLLDGQARAFHDGYRTRQTLTPGAQRTDSGVPWEQLDDELRVSNRRAAAHIRAKADVVGFDLEGWLGSIEGGWYSHELPPAADLFNLEAPGRLDALVDLEHRRWLIDRALNGWSRGPRDNIRKTRPDMKPTAELDEEAKEKDRDNIRRTVLILREIIGSKKRKPQKRK